MAAVNKCGTCKACCIILPIKHPDLRKEAGEACKHLCQKGCGIYAQRPRPCSKFKCTWLASSWPIEFRPDKLGFMFMMTKRGLKGFPYEGKRLHRPNMEHLLRQITKQTEVTLEL